MKKYNKKKSGICCTLLGFLFCIVSTCPVMGQVTFKKILTEENYEQWSKLLAHSLSDYGNWASYSVIYEDRRDTLFVRRTEGKQSYSYPTGKKGMFSGESWFACLQEKNKLTLLDLISGKERYIENVKQFEFSADGSHLVVVSPSTHQLYTIKIINLATSAVTELEGITTYSFNESTTSLAYNMEKESNTILIVLSLNSNLKNIVTLPLQEKISKIVWQYNGNGLAFLLVSKTKNENAIEIPPKLGYYCIDKNKLFILDPLTTAQFPKDKIIALKNSTQLNISDDGMRIIFQVMPKIKAKSDGESNVEIWHGDDNHLYVERAPDFSFESKSKTWIWYPYENELFDFMPKETSILLSGNQKWALSADSESCGPQFKYDSDKNFYLIDLVHRTRDLILECHTGHGFYTSVSPLGNYVAYFKEGNWFTYEAAKKLHQNLTESAEVKFFNENDDKAGSPDVYNFAGWSKDDKYLFVFDQYDLWKISSDGREKIRLTQGREKQIEFRLVRNSDIKSAQTFLSTELPTIIDLNAPLFFEANQYDASKKGLFKLDKGKMTAVYYDSKNISKAIIAEKSNSYLLNVETYEQTPTLLFMKNNTKKFKTIYQSNLQQARYFWGRNQTVSYTTQAGKKLNGILYFPANYVEGKKYPMIVNVYEDQYYLKNKYFAPSLSNGNGFNFTNYVLDGYFVFLPDIAYEVGSPGDSALDCVTAGVEVVLKLNVVNPLKIGLIGHSFGGYETTYIIGKSKLFATAVGGAAQTDLVSCYLTVGENYKKSEFWRFEDFTNRMGKMLFDDFDNYLYNSPIYNAPSISTPLLIWTGAKDGVVMPKQSMELYLALRRLGKPVSLLRYKNEHHTISDFKNKVDLTLKIKDWFNYYLKDLPLSPWMSSNANR